MSSESRESASWQGSPHSAQGRPLATVPRKDFYSSEERFIVVSKPDFLFFSGLRLLNPSSRSKIWLPSGASRSSRSPQESPALRGGSEAPERGCGQGEGPARAAGRQQHLGPLPAGAGWEHCPAETCGLLGLTVPFVLILVDISFHTLLKEALQKVETEICFRREKNNICFRTNRLMIYFPDIINIRGAEHPATPKRHCAAGRNTALGDAATPPT